jgi:2-alkyl-3-oxoalkanoate reductase
MDTSGKINLVTGATGQLGSHIAEQLRESGERVRALCRPGSDTSFLERIGVEIVPGDLGDANSVREAVRGADIVYHSAARVSDWGPWKTFEAEAVTGTRNLVEACRAGKVGRLLYVSSISVYGHIKLKPGEEITEETPLGTKFWLWDYYPQAKLLAERIAWEYAPSVTVIRPSWIYGPRDRMTVPRVVKALQQRRAVLVGSGTNLLNIIYGGDVAGGCILAANKPEAVGQAYNLCSQGEVTQSGLLNALTDALQLPRVTRRIPYGLALRAAFFGECLARLIGRKKPPTVTRRAIFLIGRSTHYSIAKARTQLGWQPRVGIQDGVRRSLEWYFANRNEPMPALGELPKEVVHAHP